MSKNYTATDADQWIFRKIIDINPTPVLITDKKGRIVYVNEEFTNVTGYSKSELIGKSPNILKSGEHPHSYYQDLWKTIQSGKTWTGEICNKRKNGEIYWEKEIIAPITSEDGTREFYISIRIDDTEKRRADLLEQIKQLAGGVAHEFSQPLQVLTIMASMLEMHPDKFDYLKRMQQSVSKISELVTSLKNLTTLENRPYLNEKILDLQASAATESTVITDKSILIIDDENELREILMDGLRLEGYVCLGAKDALSALELIKKNTFDLILSDISLPGTNGIELFKIIHEQGYNGNFLFMTGYAIEDFMKDTILKADGIIQKPFQLVELNTLLSRIFAL